jgi:hypothetical protein
MKNKIMIHNQSPSVSSDEEKKETSTAEEVPKLKDFHSNVEK